jgi:hypothetical protein
MKRYSFTDRTTSPQPWGSSYRDSYYHNGKKIYMNKIAHLFLLALAIAIMTMLAAIAWSQPTSTAAIFVTVLDSVTKEPLVRSPVQISHQRGAVTNNNGVAKIFRVEPKAYTLKVSSVGYKTKLIDGIIATIDDTAHIEVLLSPRIDTAIITLPDAPRNPKRYYSVRAPRQTDTLSRNEPPLTEDLVSGNTRSRLRVSEVSVANQAQVDTTSRVYRVYYKR